MQKRHATCNNQKSPQDRLILLGLWRSRSTVPCVTLPPPVDPIVQDSCQLKRVHIFYDMTATPFMHRINRRTALYGNVRKANSETWASQVLAEVRTLLVSSKLSISASIYLSHCCFDTKRPDALTVRKYNIFKCDHPLELNTWLQLIKLVLFLLVSMFSSLNRSMGTSWASKWTKHKFIEAASCNSLDFTQWDFNFFFVLIHSVVAVFHLHLLVCVCSSFKWTRFIGICCGMK